MVLGYTHGEIALTVFIFVLIYGAGFLPRAGRAVGRMMNPGQKGAEDER